jgi:hypothetical protein
MANYKGGPGGAPEKFRSAKELEKKAEEYFATHQIWTVAGLTLYLGFCSVQSLHDYQKRSKFSDAILRIRTKLQSNIEEKLYNKQSGAGASFWLRCQAGWRDKTEIDVTSGGQQLSAVPISIVYQEVQKDHA